MENIETEYGNLRPTVGRQIADINLSIRKLWLRLDDLGGGGDCDCCYKVAVPFTYSGSMPDDLSTVYSPYYSPIDDTVVMTEILITARSTGDALDWTVDYLYAATGDVGVAASGTWAPGGEYASTVTLSPAINLFHGDLLSVSFTEGYSCSPGGWADISLIAYLDVNCGVAGSNVEIIDPPL